MPTRVKFNQVDQGTNSTVSLTENARAVLTRRYLRKGPDGKPVESIEQMFRRVAHHVALAEQEWGGDVAAAEEAFYDLLTGLDFFPNSPTFTGAGTPLGQLAACFVLPISDDMGRDGSGIFQTLRDAALIQQTGGGNGFSFSRLRPKGALVASSAGQATGPVGFLRVYDKAFDEIKQGGARRGANMSVLRVDHPDIFDFIKCKTSEDAITNFNISVGVTDEFMRAVEADADFDLVSPQDGSVWRLVKAREIFDAIVRQAHHNGEPGVLFLDAANRQNPVPHLYELEATNPCGEQWLGPYENCCLGSINLAQHVTQVDGRPEVDWERLEQTVAASTRFLDDVVTANAYVPAVPQLQEAAHRARRIGLGIMGLGDLMYHLGIRYGSQEAQEFAGQVMEFVRYHAMRTSVELAQERGPFPAIAGSLYDPENLKWTPPRPVFPYSHDWGRPALDWEAIVNAVRQHGIRNAAQTTVAPTGCLVPGTLITTDRGLLPIEELGNVRGERWQEIDLMVASENGSRFATQFYINGKAHTIRLVTKRGYVIQGTDGHRVRLWEAGEWVWRRLDEIRPGATAALQSSGLIGEPLQVLLDTTLATEFHAAPIHLPTRMTADLAYLLGFFMGDGSLKARSLRFSVSSAVVTQRLTELLHSLFGVSPRIHQDSRSANLIDLSVHSRNLVEFWKNNGFAKEMPRVGHMGKGYRPHIPLAVLRTNDREIYNAFLAGLFDADGTVHRKHHISWTTTHEAFHNQVKTLLLTLGVPTTSDLQTTGMGQSIAYRLRTAHTESARRLAEELTYLCRAIPGEPETNRPTLGDTIPMTVSEYGGLLSIASRGIEERRVWGWRQRGFKASRSSLSQFTSEHQQEMEQAGLTRFVELVENDILFDEVVVVEDGGWCETYDISVPGTHAYIGNGFISHNTIATVAGCEAYGCEPVFALAYVRHVNDNGRDLELTYASPLFEKALVQAGLDPETRRRIVEQVSLVGSCQGIEELPAHLRHTFVVTQDISVEEHVRMQAALQAFVDNSISKTINCPATATEKDVADAYFLAWKLGCKGLTVYVTGSREKVVLETQATRIKKEGGESGEIGQPTLFPEPKKPRSRMLPGQTYRIGTPLGTTFITVNENGGNEPFEVFLHTSKAGSETAAVSEAIGRLISYVLRLSSQVPPRERLAEVVRQLEGIGGGRPLGFGAQRVLSLPDAVAQVLAEYLGLAESGDNGRVRAAQEHIRETSQLALQVGDLCPECGAPALVREEGCRKCYACGYSEC
jgi:adenosylcobalamin-dependent ribonucleoside-diphosphate reductase